MLLGNSDKHLKEHLRRRNATSTSKTVQEEVVRITGEYIRAKVTQPIQKENAFFSMIGDEVTDKYANLEILSVCLRFLDLNNDVSPQIKEVFFDFVNLDKTTGESIANAILSSLAEKNIAVAFARGQAYDGASAMSSEACGVQGRIRRIAPIALYTHCNSHVLNLSVAAACRLTSVRNMIGTFNETFLFFHFSPKRQRFLEQVLEKCGSTSRKEKLKGLRKTPLGGNA